MSVWIGDKSIESMILVIRDHKVMLDNDLAGLYGVPTKVLNQAVKRKAERFPADLMFQLTTAEKAQVVTICDHLRKLKFSPVLPYAFTEHGALMLASVLNSPRAVEMSLYVVRAFVKVRELLAAHKELSRRLDELEEKYNAKFKGVFRAIRALMDRPVVAPPHADHRPIPKIKGFTARAK